MEDSQTKILCTSLVFRNKATSGQQQIINSFLTRNSPRQKLREIGKQKFHGEEKLRSPKGLQHHSDYTLQQHIFEKSSSVGTRTLSISPLPTCTASSTSTYHIQKYQTTHKSRLLAHLVCLTNATLIVLYSLEEIMQKNLSSFHTSPVNLNITSQCLGGRCPLSPGYQGTALPAQN